MSRIPTAAEKLLLRTVPFRSKTFMVIEKGTSLFTAKVNDGSIEEGATEISYDGDSGEDKVLPGMTLFNKSLDELGNEKGSVRIKSINTGTKKIYVEPNSVSWANDDDLLVDGVFRLYRILPKIVDGVVYEDQDKTYSNQNDKDKRKPVALMGSPRYAWTGEPINFYGWRSYAKAYNVDGERYPISGYLWDFDGGTIVAGDATDPGTPTSPISVKWETPGERHVSLEVIDGNSNTHKAYRPVIVVDRPGQGESPPYQNFEIESFEGDWESGEWRASIRLMGEATPSDVPNNALVIPFCEDWYGDTKGSIGGWFGQEDILLCANVIEDSVRQDAETGDVTFEITSIVNQLKQIDVWPLNFKRVTGTPSGWHEFKEMTIEDVFWHIVEEHTTLKNIADVFIWTGVTGGKRVDFVDITEASVYDQLDQQLLSAIFGHLVSSRYSSVHGNRNFNMLNMDQRIEVGYVMMNLEKQDRLDDLEIAGERHRDAVCQVDFIGFIYNAEGDPIEVYSLAPENQRNFGRVEKETGILLTGSTIEEAQDEANELAGLYLAYQNIRFPSITVKLGNYRIFDPAHQDLVGLVVQPDDTPRGYDWYDPETGRAKEFITRRVGYEIDHEGGYMTAVLGLEASTWGKDGTAGPYPPVPPPPVPPGPPPWPPPPPPEPWRKKVYISTLVKGIYYTEDFSGPGGGDPTWESINDGLASLATTQIIADGFAPAYRQYTHAAHVAYRREGGGSWTPILNAAIIQADLGITISAWRGNFLLRGNINAQGHIYALVGLSCTTSPTERLYFCKSIDYGDSWTYTLIYSHYAYWASPDDFGVGAFRGGSAYAAGQVIYAVYRKGDGGNCMKVSTNQGATFGSEIDLPICGSASRFVHLSVDPADQDIIYLMAHGVTAIPSTAQQRFYKSIDRGTNLTDLITCSTAKAMSDSPNVYIWEHLKMVMGGGRKGNAASQAWVKQYVTNYSDDGGETFTEYSNADNFTPDKISRVMDAPENLYGMQSDDPTDTDMVHVIAVSDDWGQHWEGKAGSCPEGVGDPPTYPGSVPKDCGGVSGILQVWTE